MWPFWRSLWILFLSVSVQSGLGLNPSNRCNSGTLGLADLRIQDSQLTAQSYYESLSIGGGKSVDTKPKCARLNKNNCAWCAPRGNGQYLQVDLRRNFIITGIATQGLEALSDYYVRRYKVSHSRNGLKWSTFPHAIRGNRDGGSVVKHTFSPPMYARYIRVYPMAYRYRICMRMELYGCSNSSSALGTTPSPTTLSVANNATPENVPPTTRTKAISSTEKPIASSALSTTPSSTTLSSANNETPKNVPPTTRTTAAPSTEKPMISDSSSASSALSTTPSSTALSAANNIPENVPLTTRAGAASSKEKPMTLHSTTASSALSTTPSSTTLSGANNIPENVPPTTRAGAASSTEKLMISHSASDCTSPLGLEDLRIQDSQLTAQSHYESLSIGGGKSVDTEPKCARLNKNNCAWCAPRGNGQYLQVDLRCDFNITGIATQGFEALSDYYVMRYKVSHSRDGLKWITSPKVIKGNHDGRSVVKHTFKSPLYARYIRVYPMAYRYRICMRMELYGCSNSASAVSTTPSSTTLSGANNAVPENVPSTTKTKAASSTKKRTGQPVGSGEGLTTTPSAEGAQQSGGQALQTGNVAKEMVNDSSRKRASKTVMIALIVVALALVIIICLLVVWLRLRGRKRSYRYSSPKMEVQLL